jgi:hypothetical protein
VTPDEEFVILRSYARQRNHPLTQPSSAARGAGARCHGGDWMKPTIRSEERSFKNPFPERTVVSASCHACYSAIACLRRFDLPRHRACCRRDGEEQIGIQPRERGHSPAACLSWLPGSGAVRQRNHNGVQMSRAIHRMRPQNGENAGLLQTPCAFPAFRHRHTVIGGAARLPGRICSSGASRPGQSPGSSGQRRCHARQRYARMGTVSPAASRRPVLSS